MSNAAVLAQLDQILEEHLASAESPADRETILERERGGLVLDPRTGRPRTLSRQQEEDALRLAPPHVLAGLERARELGRLAPTADRQYFRTLTEPLPTADLAAVAPAAATETALWPVATWTSFPAFTPRSGQAWKLTAFGVQTTPASPGTITITPRWGTTTAGVTLGASTASATQTVSLTNVPWTLELWLQFRLVRNDTATQTILVGVGNFTGRTLSAAPIPLMFGGTVATVDTTTAQGIFIGIAFSAASNSITPRAIFLESLN